MSRTLDALHLSDLDKSVLATLAQIILDEAVESQEPHKIVAALDALAEFPWTGDDDQIASLGALISGLVTREIMRDLKRSQDQPLDVKRLRDITSILKELRDLQREERSSNPILVQFVGNDTEGVGD